MWLRLKCTCGYQWWTETDSSAPHAKPSGVCPQCGAFVDTVTINGVNLDSRDDETVDSPSPGSEAVPNSFGSAVGPHAGTPAAIAGYEIHGEVGRGAMGVVLRAFSPKLDRVVALKVLQRIDPAALQRFKQEFRSLVGVAHPNLVTLHELVSDGATWFISMELVDGADFQTYVSTGRGDHEDLNGRSDDAPHHLPLMKLVRIRRGMAQLTAAVAALHQAGVLHRDIKPSNVLVTPEERVVLLDFGLAAEMEDSGAYLSTDAGVVGTVAYMSPEQAASEPVTEASDWYSVGVMLYEALTDTLPFSGKPLDVLQQKQQTEPPSPSAVTRGVPDDLDQLCVDLLRREPERRPPTAEILQRLNANPEGIPLVAERSVAGSESAVLVGRDHHLSRLDACYSDMEQGHPVVLFVHGESGMGKTAVVQAFLEDVRQRHGAVVLAGRCYEQESVPFKALDSLIDALSHHLRHAPQREAEGLMPRDIQALTRVFPVLGRVKATYSAARRTLRVADQQELRRRAVAALREMLARLGDRHPLVLFIDDLQWGDVDSASMLCELIKPPDPPLLTFIGAYRDEDADTSSFLKTFWETRRQSVKQLDYRELAVGPLKRSECLRVAQRLIADENPLARQHADIVARESGGSPFFVCELARFLKSAKVAGSAGTIDVGTMIVTRVADLPREAQTLLEIIAVAGRPTPQQEVLRAAGLKASGPALLARLKAEHLIRSTSAGGKTDVETYHDRIREAMLARLTDDERRQAHGRWAETIRSSLDMSPAELIERTSARSDRKRTERGTGASVADWQKVFDVAFHLDASGVHEKAFPYAMAAAEQARSQHSLEVAERQYRIAVRGSASADLPTCCRIAEGLGDVLMLRGRYEKAWQMFEAAKYLAKEDDPQVKAKIEGRLGELAFKRGDMKQAATAIERGLRHLGRWVPSRRGIFACFLAWETVVQLSHSLFPRWFVGRRRLEECEADFLAIRLYGRLAHPYWFARGTIPSLYAHLRELNAAERYRPTPELARAYSNHAVAMSLIGNHRRAEFYAQESLRMRQEADYVWGQAQSLHYHGIALFMASRFEECIEKCTEAIRLFERTGDYWELNMARYQLAASRYHLGDLQGAQAEARRMHQSGLELGDIQASGLSVDILSKAACGKVSESIVRAELDRPRGDDAQTTSQVLQGEGVRLVAKGKFREAAQVFERGFAVAYQAGVRHTYIVPCLPWMATALRREAERLGGRDPAESKRLLQRARQAANRGVRLARKFQNDLPHALREQGLLAAASGRFRRARRCLEEGLQVADRQGARYEYAQTLLALGQTQIKQGILEGHQQVTEAKAMLEAITSEAPNG